MAVVVERLDNLIKKQATDEKKAEDWREKFDSKLDTLKSDIAALPCPARVVVTDTLQKEVERVDGRVDGVKTTAGRIILYFSLAVITFAVAWGSLSATVSRDTGIIHDLQVMAHPPNMVRT